jgi:hypothetical protein
MPGLETAHQEADRVVAIPLTVADTPATGGSGNWRADRLNRDCSTHPPTGVAAAGR